MTELENAAMKIATQAHDAIKMLVDEIQRIDGILARRPAIEGITERWRKIEHACSVAGKSDRLQLELDAIKKELDAIPGAGRVREGGGPENVAASVALTIAKLKESK